MCYENRTQGSQKKLTATTGRIIHSTQIT